MIYFAFGTSRHLGLKTAGEVADLQQKLGKLADALVLDLSLIHIWNAIAHNQHIRGEGQRTLTAGPLRNAAGQ